MKSTDHLDNFIRFEETDGGSGSGGGSGFSVAVTILIALVGVIELLSNLLN